jgi:acyl-[acyl-carrier-protein]-phospholipid O-acyltransferase / long-chain-fatty-acid--[acyl-carrier-protein] ligase
MPNTPQIRRSYLPFWLELPLALLARSLYRVKVQGVDFIPSSGPAIIVSNHISYVDAAVLQLACPRRIRFVGHESVSRTSWFFSWLFRLTGTIAVGAESSIASSKELAHALAQGDLICIFPEGGISRAGQLLGLRSGFEVLARKTGVKVIPIAHDGLWGSVFSFAGNKFIWKSPRLMPTPVSVIIGKPLNAEELSLERVRECLLDQGESAFQQRPVLRRNLARESVRALAKHPFHLQIIDCTSDRREIRAGQLLAISAMLSRYLRRSNNDQRIGIVLPPGAGAMIANLAVACAGKIPVNLNFTAGRAALEASMRIAEIKTVITANPVKVKFPLFPWPDDTRDLKTEIEAAGGKKSILKWLVASWLLPNQLIPRLLELPEIGDTKEASLLFTSGSSGEPKGVALSHRNILSNCLQVSSTSVLPASGTLLACLPVFHSFGCTVTLWYPLLRGCRVVSVPSPLRPKRSSMRSATKRPPYWWLLPPLFVHS